MAHSVSIPSGVFNMIMNHCKDDRDTLLQASLASRQFLSAARFHLFSDIHLMPCNSYALAVLLCSPYTSIPHHIVNVTLDFSIIPASSIPEYIWAKYVVRCAQHFTRIHGSLKISAVDLFLFEFLPLLQRGGGFDGYTSLKLYEGVQNHFVLRKLLTKSPNLAYFNMTWCFPSPTMPYNPISRVKLQAEFSPVRTLHLHGGCFPTGFKIFPHTIWHYLEELEITANCKMDSFLAHVLPQLRILTLGGIFCSYDLHCGVRLYELNITSLEAQDLPKSKPVILPPNLRIFRYCFTQRDPLLLYDAALQRIDSALGAGLLNLETVQIIFFLSRCSSRRAVVREHRLWLDLVMPRMQERGILKAAVTFGRSFPDLLNWNMVR